MIFHKPFLTWQPLLVLAGLMALHTAVRANNITVGNAAISSLNSAEEYAMVQFDISWDNSWRGTGEVGVPFEPYNWDAAWLFIKYRANEGSWQHAWLNNTGHTAPSGSQLETGLLYPDQAFDANTNPGMGAFIYRNAIGSGTFSLSDVEVRWNYGANGVTSEDVVDVVVYAVEMVYVPNGSFYLGTGGSESGCFTNGSYNADQVISIVVTTMGAGYDAGNPPTVEITGGGGTGCEAHVSNIMSGGVRGITVSSKGYGYTSTPTVSIVGGDGSGATATASLGPQGATSFAIIGEGEVLIERSSNNLWGTTQNIGFSSTIGPPGTLPAAFPKGRNAFYCMKHEITQQQYVDFLNSLSSTQASARFPNQNGNNRHAISVSDGVYSSTLPDVACNYLSWSDIAAILDWMALRPMTELEYEKACKGTASPSANQYPSGTGAPTAATGLSNEGNSDEVPANSSNAAYNNSLSGPIRVGAFAGAATDRETSGATYYGILEMGGNVREWVIGIGKETGRNYTGVHGDGLIHESWGTANVLNWPQGSTPEGPGMRGGDWQNYDGLMRVSDRMTASMPNSRLSMFGGRGVRSAP